MVGQDDEGGQILTFTSQRVGDPRARTREAGENEARRLQERALAVDAGFPNDVVDEGDVIDDITERRDDFAQHLAAFPVRLESPGTGEAGAGSALEQLDGLTRIPRSAVFLFEERFVVKGVDMTRRTGHEELDDPLRPRRRVQRARKDPVTGKEVGERETGEGCREGAEKLAAIGKSRFTHGVVCVKLGGVHGRKHSRVG